MWPPRSHFQGRRAFNPRFVGLGAYLRSLTATLPREQVPSRLGQAAGAQAGIATFLRRSK
jgi:hypothetical protein